MPQDTRPGQEQEHAGEASGDSRGSSPHHCSTSGSSGGPRHLLLLLSRLGLSLLEPEPPLLALRRLVPHPFRLFLLHLLLRRRASLLLLRLQESDRGSGMR